MPTTTKHQKNPHEVNRAITLGAYPGPLCRRSRWHRELAAPDRLRLDGLRRRGWQRRSEVERPIGKISAECCSFSAVSAPIFASKYAFFSIFQNLPDYLAKFLKFGEILQISILQYLQNYAEFCQFS